MSEGKDWVNSQSCTYKVPTFKGQKKGRSKAQQGFFIEWEVAIKKKKKKGVGEEGVLNK